MLTQIAPEDIIKPHQDYNKQYANMIVGSMDACGWQGRPLLAVEINGCYQGLTGTHRLYAAEEIFETIPVYVISEEQCLDAGMEAETLYEQITGILSGRDRDVFFAELGDDEAAAIYNEEYD